MVVKAGFCGERTNDKLQSRLASKLIAFLVPVVAPARRCDKNRNNMTAMSVFHSAVLFLSQFSGRFSTFLVRYLGIVRSYIRSRFFIDRVASMLAFYWVKCETLMFSIKVSRNAKKSWKVYNQTIQFQHSWFDSTVFNIHILSEHNKKKMKRRFILYTKTIRAFPI